MRYILALIGILGSLGVTAHAQTVTNSSLLLATPFADPFSSSSSIVSLSADEALSDSNSTLPFSWDLTVPSAPMPPAAAVTSLPKSLSKISTTTAEPDPSPQVLSVYPTYRWQAYGGFTFFRFYETSRPTVNENTVGANWSIVYYIFRDWIGIDGEMAATHGMQNGHDSWFLFGGGGPRFRWWAPRGTEIWGHFLFGGSHFTPQTAFGPQEAIAYEVGAGIDIGGHNQRWALRFSGDMIGSHYFSTYQFSPKISAGFIFKF